MVEKTRMEIIIEGINEEMMLDINYFLQKFVRNIGAVESSGKVDNSSTLYRFFTIEK